MACLLLTNVLAIKLTAHIYMYICTYRSICNDIHIYVRIVFAHLLSSSFALSVCIAHVSFWKVLHR